MKCKIQTYAFLFQPPRDGDFKAFAGMNKGDIKI